MPDGRRKRRHSVNAARRTWYAEHRSRRFCRRFGWTVPTLTRPAWTAVVRFSVERAVTSPMRATSSFAEAAR